MSRKIGVFGILIISFIMVSCGKIDEVLENAVVIQENNKIIGIITEDFDLEYYKVEELQTMLDEEIKAYNKEAGVDRITAEPVSLITPEEGINKVMLNTIYASAKDYEAFNEVTLFVGTVENAITQGYDIDISLIDANNSTLTMKINEIEDIEDLTLVITNEAIQVKVPEKILYYSKEFTSIDSKQVGSEEIEEYAYLLYS